MRRVHTACPSAGCGSVGAAPSEYSDALKSARQEAAGFLARDRIPRDYEGMVKPYFDLLEPENAGTMEAGKNDAGTIAP